jgi:tetratricopeptide (TPR) repeat protein
MRASDQRSRNRTKLTRKELKAPDEFITATGRLLSFLAQHLRTISFVLGGIIAAIVVVWGLSAYVHGIERNAFASLWQIEGQLRTVTDANAIPTASVERLQEIVQQFGAGEARGYAWLYLGHVHYRRGEYGTAATAYMQATASVQPTDLLWTLASVGTAYALEASGEFKQAQEAYQRVIDAKPMGFLLEAYLGKARSAAQGHDVDTALTAYAVVVEQFPARAEAMGIVDKVEALKARR